jgi:hypothetical protein
LSERLSLCHSLSECIPRNDRLNGRERITSACFGVDPEWLAVRTP